MPVSWAACTPDASFCDRRMDGAEVDRGYSLAWGTGQRHGMAATQLADAKAPTPLREQGYSQAAVAAAVAAAAATAAGAAVPAAAVRAHPVGERLVGVRVPGVVDLLGRLVGAGQRRQQQQVIGPIGGGDGHAAAHRVDKLHGRRWVEGSGAHVWAREQAQAGRHAREGEVRLAAGSQGAAGSRRSSAAAAPWRKPHSAGCHSPGGTACHGSASQSPGSHAHSPARLGRQAGWGQAGQAARAP